MWYNFGAGNVARGVFLIGEEMNERGAVQGATAYPTLIGLLPPKLTIHDGIPMGYFTVRNCDLLVSVLLHDGEGVYLIDPANAPPSSCRLIFPQEKVKRWNDQSFGQAVIRCLQEELGIKARLNQLHQDELYRFENHLPASRTGGVPKTKCIIYFAAYVPRGTKFRTNPKEVRGEVVRVTDDDYLDATCASERVRKCTAQSEAMVAALNADLLKRDAWSIFSTMLSRTKEPVAQ